MDFSRGRERRVSIIKLSSLPYLSSFSSIEVVGRDNRRGREIPSSSCGVSSEKMSVSVVTPQRDVLLSTALFFKSRRQVHTLRGEDDGLLASSLIHDTDVAGRRGDGASIGGPEVHEPRVTEPGGRSVYLWVLNPPARAVVVGGSKKSSGALIEVDG